jgi:hypothetical protein
VTPEERELRARAYARRRQERRLGALIKGFESIDCEGRSRSADGSPAKSAEQEAGRNGERYGALIERLRSLIDSAVPARTTVAVVSRGDARLLDLDGRRGWHFPQTNEGVYAGHHPGGSEEAIAHLESLSVKGAEYFLVPATARWWLDHYKDFRRHLERWYRVVVDEEDTCVLFSLREPPAERPSAAEERAARRYSELIAQLRELVDRTLPSGAVLLVLNEGNPELLELLERDGREATPFPTAGDGADEQAAAELKKRGNFLVVPATARWWLDCRPTLKRELERRHPLLVRQEHVCDIYELGGCR